MTASAIVQKRLWWRSYLASFQQQQGGDGAAQVTSTLAFMLVSTMTATTVAVANHLLSRSRLEEGEGKGLSSTSTNNNDPSFQIEIDFMDKLANKSYLRLYSNYNSSSKSKNNTMTMRDNYNERPRSVPHSLRLLSVDVPELRRGFRSVDNHNKSGNYYYASSPSPSSSWCSQVSSRVYTDGVASPKLVQVNLKHQKQHEEEEEGANEEEDDSAGDDHPKNKKKRQPPARRGRRRRDKNKKKDSSSNNAIEIEVDQKVWVQSMYECYTSTKGFNNPSIQIVEANTRTLNPRQLRRTYPFTAAANESSKDNKDKDKEELVISKLVEDESDAPWNQYAWLQEMELRISGNVPFGDPLEPANWYNKWLFGDIYNRCCCCSDDDRKRRSWWSSLIPTSYKYQQQVRDSNKPHAVIANRTQMQYVPHALRRLQTICRNHNVPLFVIEDNNNDLGDVLRQVRSSVKERIVLTSLQESSAWAYNWGRYVGQMETEAKLRSQQLSRQVTQVLMRSSSSSGNRRNNKNKVESWSKYSATKLESELAKRGVHIIDANTDAAGSGSDTSKNNKGRSCNEALVALSRRCLAAAAADEEGRNQGGDSGEKIGTTVTPTTTTTTA